MAKTAFILLGPVLLWFAVAGCKRQPERSDLDVKQKPSPISPDVSKDDVKLTIETDPRVVKSSAEDQDGDGLTAMQEQLCKTRDDRKDSDDDGVNDPVECATDGDKDGVSLSTEKGCKLSDSDPASFKTLFKDKASLYKAEATDIDFARGCLYADIPTLPSSTVDKTFDPPPAEPGLCGCSSGIPTDPCNDCDGDGLSYETEQTCHTLDTSPFSNPNGISDYQLCLGETGNESEPITEPQTLVLEYHILPDTKVLSGILGTYIGKEQGAAHSSEGRDVNNVPIPGSTGTCPVGELLVGIEACSSKYVENVAAIFCAPLQTNGTVDIVAKHRVALPGPNSGWGGPCGGTTLLDKISTQASGNASTHVMECNSGGDNSRFVTNISGEYQGGNITKMAFACGKLNTQFAKNPVQLFLEEQAQETFGGNGIGDLCRELGGQLGGGGDSVQNVGCSNGYAAVGIAVSYTAGDATILDNLAAAAGGAATTTAAVSCAVTGPACPIAVGALGVTLMVGAAGCQFVGELPVVHSFQLVCQKVHPVATLRTMSAIKEDCPELKADEAANPEQFSVADHPECMAVWGVGVPAPASY